MSADTLSVEIYYGPYLVKPVKKKFDNGERPYNIHASNIIWNDQGDYKVVDLWQNKQGNVSGRLLKFDKTIQADLKDARIVVIKGKLEVKEQILKPGSLVSLKQRSNIKVTCASKDCIFYLKTDQDFKLSL
ncbi:MAG: DUF4437 domain-containing protein [Bacteriovoracaceae bacterium]